LTLAHSRTINVFGMTGRVDVVLPFAVSRWKGLRDGIEVRRDADGLADPTVGFAVDFIGAPALSGKSFRRHSHGTIVGASLRVRIGTGQYDGDKLINLGTNRWTFVPRIGASHRFGRLTVELFATAYIYTTNHEFLNGQTLRQKPLFGPQLHLVYQLRSGLWTALSVGRVWGGSTSLDGVARDDTRSMSGVALTIAAPVSAHHSVKVLLLTHTSVRLGADFDSVALAWQYRWGGGLSPSGAKSEGGIVHAARSRPEH